MQHFADVSWLRARYEVTIDGEVVQHGALRLPDIAPGATENVEIAGLNPDARTEEEAFVTIYFETAHDLPWAMRALPAGRTLPPPQPLFRKLDDEELAGLVQRLAPETPNTGEPL